MATKVDRNNTSFQAQLKESLNKVPKPTTAELKKGTLLYHQRLKLEYMINHPTQRGIYIIDDPGYGKTRSASAIAEYCIKDGYKALVLSALSLHKNQENDIFKYKRPLPENDKKTDAELRAEIKQNYTFVSLNASNMAEQLDRVAKTGSPKKQKTQKARAEQVDLIDLDEKLEAMLGVVSNLEGYVIIVDEAHNLFNSIANGSKNAKRFYDMVMDSKKIKIVFLSGSGIVNDPSELIACFNMIVGPINGPGGRSTILTEDWEEFHRYFVDVGNKTIKNKDKFQNRILGLVSYSGTMYETEVKSQTGRKDVIARKGFPDEAYIKIEHVPMSHKQYSDYVLAKHKEDQESGQVYGQKVKSPLVRPGFVSSSTYKVHTRQISNMLLPDYVNHKDKRVETIHDSEWKDWEVYAPKFKAIVDNMKKHNINIVYSQFKGPQGIGGLARAMEVNVGYKRYQPHQLLKNQLLKKVEQKGNQKEGLKKGGASTKYYAVITGDVPSEERDAILDYLKSPDNIRGQKLSVLLLTSAGAEGLDTSYARATHQMEPYWNPAREEQFKARAVRIRSHDALPAKERLVEPYIYLAVAPLDIQKDAQKKGKKLRPTTDEEIYAKAEQSRHIIKAFRHALIEASIDCLALMNTTKESQASREGLKCVICQPTNEKLHHTNMIDDMKSISPCKPYIEEKVSVKEVLVDGKKYYYKKPTLAEKAVGYRLEIYEYSEVLDAYSPLDEQDPLFELIQSKI